MASFFTKNLQRAFIRVNNDIYPTDYFKWASTTISEKAPKEKKAAPKKKKNPWSDEDSEDERPKKAAKKRPAKKFDDSDVSDLSEEEFAPKKAKTNAKVK